jgi:hypothetical protein
MASVNKSEQKYALPVIEKRSLKIAEESGMIGHPTLKGMECPYDIPFYSELFKWLKGQGVDKSRVHLEKLYGKAQGEQEDYYPRGADLAAYLHRVLHINWFFPSKNYSVRDLEPVAKELTRKLGYPELELRMSGDYQEAFKDTLAWVNVWAWGHPNDALVIGRKTAWTQVRTNPLDLAFRTAELEYGSDGKGILYSAMYAGFGASRYPADKAIKPFADEAGQEITPLVLLPERKQDFGQATWQVSQDAGWNTSYILSRNISPLKDRFPESPYEDIIKMYELGLFITGIDADKKRLWVWHPPVKKLSD